MNSPPPSALRVAPIGLDQRQFNALQMVFDGPCRGRFRFVDHETPQACIVDLDHVGAVDLLGRMQRAYGALAVLLLSSAPPGEAAPVLGGSIYLRKPFRIDAFLTALDALQEITVHDAPAGPTATPIVVPHVVAGVPPSLPAQRGRGARHAALLLDEEHAHTVVGTAPDVDLNDPAHCRQIYYDPQRFLQGHVTAAWAEAQGEGRPVGLDGPWPAITLFPAERRVHLAQPLRSFRAFASMADLVDGAGVVRAAPSPTGEASVGQSLPYATFLWQLSLWAARGRLPQGTPVDVPVYLRHWPNFTRLEVIPWSLALAALWSREPHTLRHSASVLRAPQRFVFAFYSAAQALNLAGITRSAGDHLTEPRPLPEPGRPHGLLRRILDHLRGDWLGHETP